jgi:hypothetical protein
MKKIFSGVRAKIFVIAVILLVTYYVYLGCFYLLNKKSNFSISVGYISAIAYVLVISYIISKLIKTHFIKQTNQR